MRHIWVIESRRKEKAAPWKISRTAIPFTNKNDASRYMVNLIMAYQRQEFRLIKYTPDITALDN
jgi:hypothetical protein